MSLIPDELFDIYETYADEFLNNSNIGVDAKLVYITGRTTDNSTSFAGNTGPSFNNGGLDFSNTPSHQSQNTNNINTTQEKTIRLRVYWNKKDWKVAAGIQIPDAEAMVIGFLSDLPDMRKSSFIVLPNDLEFVLAGEPFPHGFGKRRYFMGFLKRR